MVSSEIVSSLYLQSETHKKERGVVKYETKTPKIFNYIHNWRQSDLPLDRLESLQAWVTPDTECGTYQIFKSLNTANTGEIAAHVAQLRSEGTPQITSWLEAVDPKLADLAITKQVEPIMLIRPACFIQGNVFDGNHRILSLMNYGSNHDETSVEAIIGTLPITLWCLYFIRSFFTVGNISSHDRILIAQERLRNLNPHI